MIRAAAFHGPISVAPALFSAPGTGTNCLMSDTIVLGARNAVGLVAREIIPSREEPLFTVIVDDAATRSTLVARLAMSGANMCTAQSFDERGPTSTRNAAAILVTDQATIDTHPGGGTALLGGVVWRRIMVLTSEPAVTSQDPRLIYVERNDAVPAIARLRAEAQRG
jgi:hypothetical protein